MKEVEYLLSGEEEIPFGDSKLKIIATPGHTKGGICLYFEEMKWLFTGDTLFKGTVGRTDLKGGNYTDIILSVNERLRDIPNEVIIFPGHGENSTMGEERLYNDYFER